jgi:hypothetical protein
MAWAAWVPAVGSVRELRIWRAASDRAAGNTRPASGGTVLLIGMERPCAPHWSQPNLSGTRSTLYIQVSGSSRVCVNELVEFGQDHAGVGVVKVVEDGQGLLVGIASGVAFAGGLVDVAEVGEGGRFQIAVAEVAN